MPLSPSSCINLPASKDLLKLPARPPVMGHRLRQTHCQTRATENLVEQDVPERMDLQGCKALLRPIRTQAYANEPKSRSSWQE